MKLFKRAMTVGLALAMSAAAVACTGKTSSSSTSSSAASSSADSSSADSSISDGKDYSVKPDTDKYIELALNVYYNDGDSSYYANESGESIYVTEDGQYTVSFDCSKDLSSDATSVGVNSLTNLTAIYILDMGASSGNQSPLKACNIMYDKVVVDGTELTITQTEPKSAFKSSGVFDTNDPINAWDGSCVEGVDSTSDHVANFTDLNRPTTISVTFTLSDMDWDGSSSGGDIGSSESANTYVNSYKISDVDYTSMTALELSKLLGNGINLGNTLEACNRSVLGTSAPVSSYETAWGQPITTAEMMVGMKNCGFDTIRIPVAWTNMMDYENDDYTINTEFVDRVEEIVKYALDAEMFVVLNDHWDGGWWNLFGTAETRDKAWKIYESIWTTVCERFKDYPDTLIFESANEELGNSLDTTGTLTTDDKYNLTNEINQKFVDIVRNSGGNNDDRFLLIAGYNTDITLTLDDRFKMPTDTATSKLFLSVHYYTPWNYCGAEKDARWGLKSEYDDMNSLLKSLTKFTDAGYGIILGEFSAIPVYDSSTGTHTLKQNTVEFTNNFLDNCDIYNYCPCLWSTDDFFKKAKLNMITGEITDLFTGRCYAEELAAGDSYLTTVQTNMDAAYEAAPEKYDDVEEYEPGTPVAWIMWNGGAGTYSVGDVFNPSDCTEGITATNVVTDGAGTYTVSLDFAGGNSGLTFAALALADGESLYPDCILDIKEITVDGNAVTLTADPYTSSDDGKCTRVNLYNQWVNKLPDDARNASGDLTNADPCILDPADTVNINNISITFELIVP